MTSMDNISFLVSGIVQMILMKPPGLSLPVDTSLTVALWFELFAIPVHDLDCPSLRTFSSHLEPLAILM